MDKIRILLVEDEESVASFVKMELILEGYEVNHVVDGETAIKLFNDDIQGWDLIVLDWMLPKLDGLEICKLIRKNSQVPIIIMTAKDYVSDKVAGLDGGADDYITKPFEIEELLARIRVIIRRQNQLRKTPPPSTYQVDDLVLDLKKRQVARSGKKLQLTPKEFDLLAILIQNVGEVMTRENLLNKVWGYDYLGQTNVIDVYIRYLRNKVDVDTKRPLIHTVRGVGYVLRSDE